MTPRLLVADLFSGAGGLSEGFRQTGCRVLVGSDIDPDACATYAWNFPEAIAVHGDIREAKVRARITEAATMDVDVIVGGPPCQAFSQMRNHSRLIDDPRNSLYREFVRILDKLEPKAFVMENVLGLEQMGVREQVLGCWRPTQPIRILLFVEHLEPQEWSAQDSQCLSSILLRSIR